jgi:hypothetical protein
LESEVENEMEREREKEVRKMKKVRDDLLEKGDEKIGLDIIED